MSGTNVFKLKISLRKGPDPGSGEKGFGRTQAGHWAWLARSAKAKH